MPDASPYNDLLPLIYDQLRELAHRKLAFERPGHTLRTTDLVHEAYAKLATQREASMVSREHFLALAAQAMRRILVNYARDRGRLKRNGQKIRLTQAPDLPAVETTPEEILALHEALEQLDQLNERQARVVEYWFFGGYQHEEIAGLLGVSLPTVRRDWRLARAYLSRRMKAQLPA